MAWVVQDATEDDHEGDSNGGHDDSDVCAICHDDAFEPGNTLCLPGCGHRFHTHCMLEWCQYDARCPVCRSVPKGVNMRATAPPPSVTATVVTERSELFVSTLGELEELLGQEIVFTSGPGQEGWSNATLQPPRESRRTRERHRRALRRHMSLYALERRVRMLRQEMRTASRRLHGDYVKMCRYLWRTDPQLRAQRADMTNLRRRLQRAQRTLDQRMEAHHNA